jgi:hypothetical protein
MREGRLPKKVLPHPKRHGQRRGSSGPGKARARLIANEALRQFNLKFLERGGGSLLHVPLALPLAMLLNIFDVLIIEQGEVGPSFFVRTKELVELGVKSLGIAVFGSINEQRHQPRC